MTTGTLQLTYRPLAAADASAFQRFLTQIGQETVFTMQYGGKPQQEEAVIAKKLDDAASDPRSLMLGAFHEDRLAALISLRPATGDHIWTNHIAGFGLMVIKEFWGQGVATHLLQEAEEYALKVGFKRIEAEVRCQNERGVRFYKRQGYEIEGTRRAAAMIKGEIHDEYFIAKLLDETTR